MSNAKGAVIGGYIMVTISVLLAGFCVNKAQGTNWDCTFGDESAVCLQPDKKAPKKCASPPIER